MKQAKRMRLGWLLGSLLVGWGITTSLGHAAETVLLPNGDKMPEGWTQGAGVTWENENGQHFMRLQQQEAGKMLMPYHAVPIRPEDKALELHFRVRYANVRRGKENWNDARIIFHFKDAAQKQLPPDPAPIYFLGDSNGWQERTARFEVPAGAAILEVIPSLYGVASGTFDLAGLRLVAVTAGAAAAPVGNGAAPAVVAAASGVAEPTTFNPPPALRAVGNRLQSADGKVAWLQGVNVPSLDWMPEGDHIFRSVQVALDDWKCSLIRLPINDEYWYGRGPRQADGGGAYRALVDSIVQAVARRGKYVDLDLHDYKAPKPAQLAFWKAVATLYKNNPAVFFGLLNEPHDVSWDVWQKGGTVEETPRKGDTPAVTYESPGLQKVVDTIRGTGAQNVVIVGGNDWAYDLSGVLTGHALDDRGGQGIMYDTHIYNWKTDWQHKVLDVAAKYPVLIGEVGCDTKKLEFIPANNQEDPYTWAPDMLGCIQQYKLNWTAWSFHTDATPRIIADWDYNPTPFWGAWVKAALLGAKFQMNRTR